MIGTGAGGGVLGAGAERPAGAAAPDITVVWVMCGAQLWQISARVHTSPAARLWMRSSMVRPMHVALAVWYRHSTSAQAQVVWARGTARRAWAWTC